MKQKIHEALQGRVRKVLKEMRQERAHLAVGDYLHLRSAALSAGGMDETWGDLGRMIGKGALNVAGQAVADGLGIKVKSGTLSRVIKAVRKKKKKYEVSKGRQKAQNHTERRFFSRTDPYGQTRVQQAAESQRQPITQNIFELTRRKDNEKNKRNCQWAASLEPVKELVIRLMCLARLMLLTKSSTAQA